MACTFLEYSLLVGREGLIMVHMGVALMCFLRRGIESTASGFSVMVEKMLLVGHGRKGGREIENTYSAICKLQAILERLLYICCNSCRGCYFMFALFSNSFCFCWVFCEALVSWMTILPGRSELWIAVSFSFQGRRGFAAALGVIYC